MNKSSDPHNYIPFDNLDPRAGRAAPNSPYANFTEALRGWIVFDRKHRCEALKFALWARFSHRPYDIKKLIERQHKDYVFIRVEQWENM